MRINDQFMCSTIFCLTTLTACQLPPDAPVDPILRHPRRASMQATVFRRPETGAPTSSSGSADTNGIDATTEECPPDACTRCDNLADECANTPGCDVTATLEACGQEMIHCGCIPDTSGSGTSDASTTDTCFDAAKPKPGELYGPCKSSKHACDEGLMCQVADDPDPTLPKGTICLPTCWGEGHDGTCPEALDSCGEPFAKTACQSETDPLRPVPCLLPCVTDTDCPMETRCWLDRCVYEGLP